MEKLKRIAMPLLMGVVCIGVIFGISNIARIQQLPEAGDYLIFAESESGMHCVQTDYSSYMILPPGNTMKVQIYEKGGEEAELITSGIVVEYFINDNTYSVGKSNFWDYAQDYGYSLSENEGITGNFLSGIFELSEDGKYFVATAIPVVPYNDGSTERNPYQTMTVTVLDETTGEILAQEDSIVVPVSDEMDCFTCHGEVDTDANILKEHDENEGTTLYADLQMGIRYRCGKCHEDVATGSEGEAGVPGLSLAMHGFHESRMSESTLENICYNCHPGPETQCSRGVMAAEGITCSDENCHGDMQNVAVSQILGRRAWLDEPDCSNCHGELYGAASLYSSSYLLNGPDEMNGFILCLTCHNSPHAEWPSTLELDNLLPISIIGEANFIYKCTACHEQKEPNIIHGFEQAEED